MVLDRKNAKEFTVHLCPNCRRFSNDNKCVIVEEKYQCPICNLFCTVLQLKSFRVEILKRGRMWVNSSRPPWGNPTQVKPFFPRVNFRIHYR